jgi:2-keto-3-deoxy-L-rhamnonate aldolase RhmA
VKKKNIMRELLKEDKPTVGTHVHSTWPGMIEVIGYTNVIDYIEFSAEYAPYDLYSLENFGRAIDLFDHMSAMMKIEQEPRTYLAVRANGSGIQNLLFADIRNTNDARVAIASSRAETPQAKGLAGAAMRRDVGYLLGPGSEDYIQALEDGVVAFMIEKQPAIENLEEILSLDGVDMVQFGPADYAMSIGVPGCWDDPKVKEAERYVIETALKMGIRPRAEINDFEQAKPYIDMGVRDFCVGWDVVVVHEYCKKQGEGLAKLLGR